MARSHRRGRTDCRRLDGEVDAMSVVNQMLRDLDRRQASDERKIYGQHLRSTVGRNRGRWLLVGVGVLVAGGAAGYALVGLDGAKALASPQVPTTTISAAPAVVSAPSVAERPAAIPPAAAPSPLPTVSEMAATAPAAVAAPATSPAPAASPDRKQDVQPAEHTQSARLAPASRPKAPPIAEIKPAPTGAPVASTPEPGPKIDKQFRESPRSADSEFRRAAALIEQGRIVEATAALRSTIALDPRHGGARQTLAVLLIEAGAIEDAEDVLAEGLRLNPAQSNFALVLARVKLERGDASSALALLREHGGAAAANPEYRAFVAALLQRLGRHGEAIDEYQAALKLVPGVGVWWIGLGLSQEAAERPKDAAEAFRRAKASGTLSADLADFVDRKLLAAR